MKDGKYQVWKLDLKRRVDFIKMLPKENIIEGVMLVIKREQFFILLFILGFTSLLKLYRSYHDR